jgi:hypothetical protein
MSNRGGGITRTGHRVAIGKEHKIQNAEAVFIRAH